MCEEKNKQRRKEKNAHGKEATAEERLTTGHIYSPGSCCLGVVLGEGKS
jgi:hypothetical protein